MKTLYLVRHAKSSWETAGLPDDQRPLLPTGVTRTKLVADYIIKTGETVELMISSQAVRAYETARIMAACLGYPEKKILNDRRIYDGPYERILDLIYSTPDETKSLMIFGHNPLITQLSNLFLEEGSDGMPTSAVACISFHTEKWKDIPGARSETRFYITPKELKK